MSDMQLIRYRSIGPGRWKREQCSPCGCSPKCTAFLWQYTHDVRTQHTVVADIVERAESVPLSQAMREEVARYAGRAEA